MNFRTIYTPGTAYGGYLYRAVSDGNVVRIQERSPTSSSYRTKREISVADWEAYAEKYGLDNPYTNTNPAPISRLAGSSDWDSVFNR